MKSFLVVVNVTSRKGTHQEKVMVEADSEMMAKMFALTRLSAHKSKLVEDKNDFAHFSVFSCEETTKEDVDAAHKAILSNVSHYIVLGKELDHGGLMQGKEH